MEEQDKKALFNLGKDFVHPDLGKEDQKIDQKIWDTISKITEDFDEELLLEVIEEFIGALYYKKSLKKVIDLAQEAMIYNATHNEDWE